METCVWSHIGEDVTNRLGSYAISLEKSNEKVNKHVDQSEPFKNRGIQSAYYYLNME